MWPKAADAATIRQWIAGCTIRGETLPIPEMHVTKLTIFVVAALATLPAAHVSAQALPSRAGGLATGDASPVSAAAQPAQDDLRGDARRFGVGVLGGVGIDPELIDLGAHATVRSVFKPNLDFRPGLEIGVGEITTFLGINLDFLYSFPGTNSDTGWYPYAGAGPTFGLSHKGFDVEDDIPGAVDDDDDVDEPNRFDFSDTDFNGGMNFIVGMRKRNGVFFEMRATAWGVSNIRLVAGFNF